MKNVHLNVGRLWFGMDVPAGGWRLWRGFLDSAANLVAPYRMRFLEGAGGRDTMGGWVALWDAN